MERARGTRDFVAIDKIRRDEVVKTLISVFERYGYMPLETPVLEKLELLTSKFAGGEEIIKEIFKLTDQGKRELALRYDLTVPMSRFIAENPNVKLPFKNYKIGPVFRDGPIKLGRYRQFWQCDADIIGSASMNADSEIIELAIDAFKELKLDIVIKVNNRKVLNEVLKASGIAKTQWETALMSVDKLEKIGKEGVIKELKGKGIKNTDKLLKLLLVKGTNSEKISLFEKQLENKEGLREIKAVINGKANVEFDVSLARGLNYYTGTVFEGFIKDSEIKSSICGGGRYDGMIGQLTGKNQDYPAVGISFGLDVITDASKKKSGYTTTKVFVIPIKNYNKAKLIAEQLRDGGVNVDIDLNERGISKNLDYANSLQIPYVVFAGERELSSGKIKIRDMTSGKEELITVDKAIKKLSSQ